jgi:hypothetical protein
MNRYLISIVLILSLMGCAVALDVENGVEMRPGEATAERLFERGIGQPWVGGNPPSLNSFDYSPSRVWGWGWDRGYDIFSYYAYQGKTYHPYLYSHYANHWKPYYGNYRWSW